MPYYSKKRKVNHAYDSYPGILKIDEFLPAAVSGYRNGLNIYGLRRAAIAVGFAEGTVSSSRTRCVRAGTLLKIGKGSKARYKYNWNLAQTTASTIQKNWWDKYTGEQDETRLSSGADSKRT